MSDLIRQLTNDLQNRIDSFESRYEVHDIGKVLEAGDGIAIVQGLDGVHSQELVQFENGVMGIAFSLERDQVGIILLGDYSEIGEGMKVHATGRIASVPVGDGLIGRVVNALGEPIDGKGTIPYKEFRPIERIAPGGRTPGCGYPGPDRDDCHGYHDPHRARAARINHWRPPDG